MAKVTSIDVDSSHKAYFAPATISASDRVVQISGQVGTTADGKAPSCYESQMHLALLNLRRALVACDCKIEDITKLNIYVVNYDPERRIHARHVQKMLGTHRPAITLVPVSQLAMPEWLFEIDGTACSSPRLPSLALTSQPPPETDVVVIGAGLSGLVAARDVIRAGLSCVILEARDRVGGKTWSQPLSDGSGNVDVGAAWINDTNQSRMYELAKQYGAELIEQNTTGNCVFQDYDGTCKPFAYGELPPDHMASIRDMCEADCQKLDVFSPQDSSLDSLTFLSYLQKNNASSVAIDIATIWTRAMLGQEPADISALYFLNYCKSGGGLLQMRSDRRDGGQYLRVRQGTQYFSKRLAADLPSGTIRFLSPVQSVTQSSGSVKVVSKGRTVLARKVIVSTPTPIYKTIRFDPPLSASKTVLSDSTTYGYYTKVMLVFKTPFWVQGGYCGLAQSFKGPASVIRDTSVPADGKHILTCFLAGSPGKAWSLLTESERQEALLQQAADAWMNGDKRRVDAQFLELIGLEWSKEEYSGWGCPCTALPPGVLDTVGHALREVNGNVHFVGTETAGEWKGYMEGAVRSGERGAGEVISSIVKKVSRL